MVLPSHLFDDAIEDRLKLVLSIDGVVYGGYIMFLPKEESEPFPLIDSAINSSGLIVDAQNYVTTDLIDVTFVEDIVISCVMRRNSYNVMWAYDDEGNPLKELVKNHTTYRTSHVEPDGTYRYIRACAVYVLDGVPQNYSLELHYRSRRRR